MTNVGTSAVYRIDPLRDSRWATLVDRHPRASIFHTVGWLEALRRTYGYRPVVFATSPPTGELKNGIVFASVRSWLTGRRIVSLPFSDHCDPLFDSADELRFMMEYLQADLEREGWKYIEVRPTNGSLGRTAMDYGFQPASAYCLHRIDLQPGLDEIFRGFDKDSVQRRIRRAERAGLIETCGRSDDLLQKFYSLLILTRKRHHLPPQPFLWFRNLVECLGEAVEVRVASAAKGNRPVAALMTLRFKDKVVYKYSASDKEFNYLGATPLLLWRVIENAKAGGATELDLGRSDEGNHGLIAFKDKWVKHSIRLVYFQFPPPSHVGASANWRLRLAKRVFACLPNSLLTAAGRSVYRHVG